MLELVESPVYVTFFITACADLNFRALDKSACTRNSKVNEACRELKEFLINISALCPLQDSREDFRPEDFETSSQLLIHFSLKSMPSFDAESQP